MAGVDNLVPFKPGEDDRRNYKGRPKGSKSWSTVVKELLDDEEFLEKIYTKRPGWFDELPVKNGHTAVAAAMMAKSLKGDEKAAKWLRETGYGNRLHLEGDITVRGAVIGFADNPEADDTDTDLPS